MEKIEKESNFPTIFVFFSNIFLIIQYMGKYVLGAKSCKSRKTSFKIINLHYLIGKCSQILECDYKLVFRKITEESIINKMFKLISVYAKHVHNKQSASFLSIFCNSHFELYHSRECHTNSNDGAVNKMYNSKKKTEHKKQFTNFTNSKKWKYKNKIKLSDLNSSSAEIVETWQKIKKDENSVNYKSKKQNRDRKHDKKDSNYNADFGLLSGVRGLSDVYPKRVIDKYDIKYTAIKDFKRLQEKWKLGSNKSLENTEKEEEDDDVKFGTLSAVRDVVDVEEKYMTYADHAEEKFREGYFGPKLRLDQYQTKIRRLLKEKKIGEALAVLEQEMMPARVPADLYIYRLLMTVCAKHGYTSKVFQLYSQMKRSGVEPVLKIYTVLFNACANCPAAFMKDIGLKNAIKLRSELQESQVILNDIVYHSMIKAFGRCGEIGTAFQLVDEMISKCLFVTNETMSFLLQSCISDEEAGFRHALIVWRRMRELRIRPDIFNYNLLLEVVEKCKAGDKDYYLDLLDCTTTADQISWKKQVPLLEGKDISFKVLEDKQIELLDDFASVDSTNTVTIKNKEASLPDLLGRSPSKGSIIALKSLDAPVDRLAVCGGSVGILHQMQLDGVEPDLKTFTKLMKSVPQDLAIESDLLSQLVSCGLQPDTAFFNIWINKCNSRKDAVSAKEVLKLMAEHHVSPDLITFGCVSKGLGALTFGTSRVKECRQFFKDMHLMSIRPNIEIFYPLIFRTLKQGDYTTAVYLLSMVVRNNIKPTESLIKELEQFRMNIREQMIKLERIDSRSTEEENVLLEMREYIKEYKKFLNITKIELDLLPWDEFKTVSQ